MLTAKTEEKSQKNSVKMSSSRKINKNNSSSSSEGDPAMIIDEKKRKRMVSNRESARRSRLKKEQHIKDLNDQISYFTAKSGEAAEKIDKIGQRYAAIESENRLLRMHGDDLKKRLELLEGMLSSHKNSSNNNVLVNNDADEDDLFVMDILQDPLLKPWLQSPFLTQTVDGIYQF